MTVDDHERDDVRRVSPDDEDESSLASVDTAAAFEETFGFAPINLSLDEEKEEVDDENEKEVGARAKRGGRSSDDDDDDERRSSSSSSSSRPLEVVPVSLPRNCFRGHVLEGASSSSSSSSPPPLAVVVRDVVSPEHCRALIERGRSTPRSYRYVTEAAVASTDDDDDVAQTTVVPLTRPHPHKLALFRDATTADRLLWTRLRDLPCLALHARAFGAPTGLNPRLRVLRYDADDDDRFDPHYDATTTTTTNANTNANARSSSSSSSRLTVLLYLNDEFGGGETVFLDRGDVEGRRDRGGASVVPRRGDALLFDHGLYHAGSPLDFGTKYVLRTDVMFPSAAGRNDAATAAVADADRAADLCRDVGASADDVDRLRRADLYDVTVDALRAPGPTALKAVLAETGLARKTVEALATEAFARR